jgi:hypothetical protein
MQRIELCLQCYLEERGSVHVYPVTAIRKGLHVPCAKDWTKNKAISVEVAGKALREPRIRKLMGTEEEVTKLASSFFGSNYLRRHNLADTFLPYLYYAFVAAGEHPDLPVLIGAATPALETSPLPELSERGPSSSAGSPLPEHS